MYRQKISCCVWTSHLELATTRPVRHLRAARCGVQKPEHPGVSQISAARVACLPKILGEFSQQPRRFWQTADARALELFHTHTRGFYQREQARSLSPFKTGESPSLALSLTAWLSFSLACPLWHLDRLTQLVYTKASQNQVRRDQETSHERRAMADQRAWVRVCVVQSARTRTISVCLPVCCLSVWLSVWLSVCLAVCLAVCVPTCIATPRRCA